MFGVLLKKQLLEINTWLFVNRKKGKRRSGAGIAGVLALYLFLFLTFGGCFFGVGIMLCEPLVSVELGWLYFAIMSLISIMFGVFGSVFSTYSSLYNAKDNEMLLSMPIPPRYILAARLFGVWFWSIIYEALVLIPAIIVYQMMAGSLISALTGVLLFITVSVIVLSLSCILGYAVAKIGKRLRSKSFVTVLLSIVFIFAYYFVYFKANEILREIIANMQVIGEKVRGFAYPLYVMGEMGVGDLGAAAVVVLTVAAVFSLIVFVLSKSFISLATSSGASARVKHTEKAAAQRSVSAALLSRECGRFTSSATYMLNCGIGMLFSVALGVFVVIRRDMLLQVIDSMGVPKSLMGLAVCAAVCVLASMTDITAPSVSLEGKNLWIAKSLPVSAWQVLSAKIRLNVYIGGVANIICALLVAVAFKLDLFYIVMLLILPQLFLLFTAVFGLAMNLKMPNLHWTNEAVPIKQDICILFAMFGGIVLIILLGAAYFLIGGFVGTELYLILCALITAAADVGILLWIYRRGTKLFDALD